MADPLSSKTLDLSWPAGLHIGVEVYNSDQSKFIFIHSYQGVRLGELGDSLDADVRFDTKKDTCLILLTKFLCVNGIKSLEEVYATPLDLVSGIHNFLRMVLNFHFRW